MTERKSFKRRVRARMEKTGERYAAARSQVERAADAPATDGAAKPVSDESLVQSTGRTWDQWLAILDAWGAREHQHGEIAAHLVEEHGLGGWWAQCVTVGWERSRGVRAKHERPDGFAISASKTVTASVERLYAAFVEPAVRERWLPGEAIGLRTSQPGRTARFDWTDGTSRLHVYFTDKGERSSVTVQHERLPNAEEAERMKAFWKDRLGLLEQRLEA